MKTMRMSIVYCNVCYSHGDTSEHTDHGQERPAVGEDGGVAEDSSHHGHQPSQQDQQARALPSQLGRGSKIPLQKISGIFH